MDKTLKQHLTAAFGLTDADFGKDGSNLLIRYDDRVMLWLKLNYSGWTTIQAFKTKEPWPEGMLLLPHDPGDLRFDPVRKWLEPCSSYWKNYSPEHYPRMVQAVAKENDLAESLGFECKPDDRRGHGWCRFERAADQTTVYSAWRKIGSQHYPWGRSQRGEDGNFSSMYFYDNFEDAIHDRNRRHRVKDFRYSITEEVKSDGESSVQEEGHSASA